MRRKEKFTWRTRESRIQDIFSENGNINAVAWNAWLTIEGDDQSDDGEFFFVLRIIHCRPGPGLINDSRVWNSFQRIFAQRNVFVEPLKHVSVEIYPRRLYSLLGDYIVFWDKSQQFRQQNKSESSVDLKVVLFFPRPYDACRYSQRSDRTPKRVCVPRFKEEALQRGRTPKRECVTVTCKRNSRALHVPCSAEV